MAHPHRADAISSSKSKFKAISGKSGQGQAHPDEGQDRALIKTMLREHDQKAGGKRACGGRIDKFARGGRANKTNITIVVPQGGGQSPTPPPAALGPGGPPLPPVAGGPPIPMRKRGGAVHMTGGADSGTGRLDKIKAYGKRARSG